MRHPGVCIENTLTALTGNHIYLPQSVYRQRGLIGEVITSLQHRNIQTGDKRGECTEVGGKVYPS